MTEPQAVGRTGECVVVSLIPKLRCEPVVFRYHPQKSRCVYQQVRLVRFRRWPPPSCSQGLSSRYLMTIPLSRRKQRDRFRRGANGFRGVAPESLRSRLPPLESATPESLLEVRPPQAVRECNGANAQNVRRPGMRSRRAPSQDIRVPCGTEIFGPTQMQPAEVPRAGHDLKRDLPVFAKPATPVWCAFATPPASLSQSVLSSNSSRV